MAQKWRLLVVLKGKLCHYRIHIVGLSSSKKNSVIYFIESLLKMMKNAFYFILKAVFVLKIFNFFYLNYSGLFHHIKNRLDYKDKANFKIHDVTTWLAKICNRHILPNISRSKDNQAMKFGRLIEYNKINIFLQKLYRK